MANDWFKLDESGTGEETNTFRPDFKGHNVRGWSGNKIEPNGGPPWLVRVYASASTLDALEADLSGSEQRFSTVPTEDLNSLFGQTRDSAGWNDGFNIGGDP